MGNVHLLLLRLEAALGSQHNKTKARGLPSAGTNLRASERRLSGCRALRRSKARRCLPGIPALAPDTKDTR